MKPTNRVQAQMITNLVSNVDSTSTGSLVTASTALNIADGEVSILTSNIDSATYGNLVTNPVGLNQFVLVQGTPKSSNIQTVDPWGVGAPGVVKSDIISKGRVRSTFDSSYNSGTLSASYYGSTVVPAILTEYGIFVELDGTRQEREYSQNTDTVIGNYTTLDTLPTDGKDQILQNIAYDINLRSKLTGSNRNVVALAINETGGSGVAIGTIDNTTVFNFMTNNGETYTMTSSFQLVRSLLAQVADSTLTEASTIEVIDLSTAGAAAKVTNLLFVGLDAQPSVYFDDVSQVRTDVTVNPAKELEQVSTVVKVFGIEAINSGRTVAIHNQDRAQLNIHTQQNHPHGEFFSEGYNALLASKNYGVYGIEFYDYSSTIITGDTPYEKKAYIYWEQSETSITVTAAIAGTGIVIADATTKPAIIANIETWVNA
jgi:hypothetical protein